jgi:hypothetical protein
VSSFCRVRLVAASPPERGADDPGQRSQAGEYKRWPLGGGLPPSTKDNTEVAVRAEIGATSSGAVLGLPRTLDEGIVIWRIKPTVSPSRGDHRVGDTPQHLIWRICSRMANFESSVRRHSTPGICRPLGPQRVVDEGRCLERVAAASVLSNGSARAHSPRHELRSTTSDLEQTTSRANNV